MTPATVEQSEIDQVLSIALDHLSEIPVWQGENAMVHACYSGKVISIACVSEHGRLDLNWEHKKFYILFCEIEKDMRGKGYGSRTYEACEQIARDLGCSRICGTPSGTTINGESRMDWSKRRGWIENGIQAYKDL